MTSFRVWAPEATTVAVDSDGGVHPLEPGPGGWWSADLDVGGGTDYRYVIDGEALPDPRTPWQPDGVHGPSRTVDHDTYPWGASEWRGFHLPSAVLYELHVGTFTSEGTFDAAVDRLDHLVELGIDAVEVMPVNAFPGRHGWGYDGVGWFAVHDAYGGPEGLKRFVDACHARGIGVILDVVYNHLGPDGAYLDRFGPYFTDRYSTPWGPAVNLDGPGSDEVRRYIVDNALQWLADYRFDGLRLDAVHALVDTSAIHVLEQLAVEVSELAAHVGRPLWLIAESDLNDPRLVRPREAGGYGLGAMWSDDLHHALHVALTGERSGYYVDFDDLSDVAYALRHGFVYDGRHSVYRQRVHGRPADDVPGSRFVGYLQNHDQIGNRARGERVTDLVSPERAAAGAALILTAPIVPLLFQGEEWAASTPFPYFTDHHDPELIEAVRRGRREEFAAFGWAPDEVADPQDPATVVSAMLRWDERDAEPHAGMLGWYRRLIALRRRIPELTDGRRDRVRTRTGADWIAVERGRVTVVVNLGRVPLDPPLGDRPAHLLLSSQPVSADAPIPPDTAAVFGDHEVAAATADLRPASMGATS
ncbi:MAG: malto-oligosyltrehalose trehalohydrolase [Actinobacteria bacterium]|nr:malto-oligosyltrehalose trehalohydrolase [Actinomycetota bacterium]